MSVRDICRRQYRHFVAFPDSLPDVGRDRESQKAETSNECRHPIGSPRCTSQIRIPYSAQPAAHISRKSHDLSEIAYVLIDDEQLGGEITSTIEGGGIRAKWFRSATSYLAHERPEVASCLLISRRLLGMPGLDLQRFLGASITPPIIVLSNDGDIPSCVRAIKDGAHEFLALPFMRSQLLEAINEAFRKDRANLAMRQEQEDLRKRWESLTSREAEVMRYVVGGFLNKQTAAELNIAENTVQVHRGRVMRKMQADSFAALVRMSLRLSNPAADLLLRGNIDPQIYEINSHPAQCSNQL
jgi:FixJ family two-component response regulator